MIVVVAGGADPGGDRRAYFNWPGSAPPGYNGSVHRHLRRLERVWLEAPVYFITTCTFERRSILAAPEIAALLIAEWQSARSRHGWAIGRYVLMPDHVHFFCAPELDAKPLSVFIGFWKEWTSKNVKRALGLAGPVWQEEFFDHVLRSGESYEQKWDYVRKNPVRAGVVARADDWLWQGEIEELRL